MIDFLLGLIGLVLPVRSSSRLYLERQLKENGVDLALLSKECLQDLTDFSIAEIKRVWGPSETIWKSRVPTLIDGEAVMIMHAIEGTGSGELYNQLRSIMRKHGVQLMGHDTVME
jgi:hypothetical protein